MPDTISIWTALADSKRRQIVALLEEKPRTTSDLLQFFDVSRFAIMKHLKVLEQANLVSVKREGRKRWNFLNRELSHFLRNNQLEEDGAHLLTDALELFPGQQAATSLLPPVAGLASVAEAVLIAASPSQVFTALTADIDAWWCERAAVDSTICLEPWLNGRLAETSATPNTGILYATITRLQPAEALHLRGTPELAAQIAESPILDHVIRLRLTPQADKTELSLNHSFVGNMSQAVLKKWQHRWYSLLHQHFKPFVEQQPAAG